MKKPTEYESADLIPEADRGDYVEFSHESEDDPETVVTVWLRRDVADRVVAKVREQEARLAQLQEQLAEREAERARLLDEARDRRIRDAARDALAEFRLAPGVEADVQDLVASDDGLTTTPDGRVVSRRGESPREWLARLALRRPHWNLLGKPAPRRSLFS